jgi:hypothetical protein
MLRRIAALALPDGWQNRKEREAIWLLGSHSGGTGISGEAGWRRETDQKSEHNGQEEPRGDPEEGMAF